MSNSSETIRRRLLPEGRNATISYAQGIKPYHRVVGAIIDGSLRNGQLRAPGSERPALLDVGCGVGNSLAAMKTDLKRIEVVVADIDENCLDICESRFPVARRMAISRTGALRESDVGQFDHVIYSHVLQYEPDPIEALEALLEVTKPGGMLIVAVSNAMTPTKMLNSVLRKRFSAGHFTWDRSSFENLLGRLGSIDSVSWHADYVPLPLVYRYALGRRVGAGLSAALPWLAFSCIACIVKVE